MTKKALLIGINQYPSAPLRGCVNDVGAMYDRLLQQFAFPPDNVRAVVDQRATTSAMKERLDWVTSGVVPGDVVVIHFSGHGSQVRDRDGDELADQMDEILCPVDLDWQTKVILDDDLAVYLKRIPKGAFCYVILDCCHSGSGTRDIRPPEEDGGNPHPEKYRRSRYLAPPFDLETRFLGRDLPRRKAGMGQARTVARWPWWAFWRYGRPAKPAPSPTKATVVPTMNHVLISGCRSDQTSADAYIGGKYTGALTHHLTKAITENPGKSVAEVHSIARLAIIQGGYTQESQLEGPAELLSRPIFT